MLTARALELSSGLGQNMSGACRRVVRRQSWRAQMGDSTESLSLGRRSRLVYGAAGLSMGAREASELFGPRPVVGRMQTSGRLEINRNFCQSASSPARSLDWTPLEPIDFRWICGSAKHFGLAIGALERPATIDNFVARLSIDVCHDIGTFARSPIMRTL